MKAGTQLFALLCFILAAASMPTAARAERSPGGWSEAAIDDLHFIRATLRENHPGPVDPTNPAFASWYRDGFERALRLAGQANSYAGYFYAIQAYVVGFQDNHLGALADDRFDAGVRLRRQWPGFILGLANGRFAVARTSPGGPPLGAVLEECDGRGGDALADEILRPYFPLWSIRGTRPRTAPFLLIDEGNPFVRRPSECRFAAGGHSLAVHLAWVPIDNGALEPMVRAAQGRIAAQTGIRRFGAHGWWIALASFDANEDAASTPLLEVIRTLETRATEFRGADVIVLDVRGNSGGNSAFGDRIASALWGADFVASLPRTSVFDWRVSPANVRQIERGNLPALQRRFGENDPQTRAYAAFVDAIKAALARGDTFYRETLRMPEARASPLPVRARVFLLTDGWCGSACLDFADLVLAAPRVVQVGAETSGDTIYIDNTGARLPSGEGFFGWSMKVDRNRPRGANQSYVPVHLWTGSMADTPGLERWLAGLARAP